VKRALLLVALTMAGCVSKGEYKDFVVAMRKYHDSVAPIVSADTAKLPSTATMAIVKQDRLSMLGDAETAIRAAEARAGLRPE